MPDGYVDLRLDLIDGRQVANLTIDDVPIVARAITACIRKKAGIGLVYANNISIIRLLGVGFDLSIRAEDWVRIAPFLVDGTFNPEVSAHPIPRMDPPLSVSTIDLQDRSLYSHVVGVLSGLFPTKFPRSSL